MTTKNTSNFSNWIGRQIQNFETNFFGAMTMMMVAQSCLGSISAMLALQSKNIPFLIIGMSLVMATNAAFLAQISAKWAVGIFASSIIVNLILIVLGLLS